MIEYIEKKFIQKNSVEKRDYQINLANQATNENCIVVLPTGLGKTTIALHVISEYLTNESGSILFLAPTRVLVNQHFDFLKKNLTIDDIVLITGEDSVEKRTDLWNHRIICATPEVARNDMNHNFVTPKQFNLVIFDEVHRTTGDYAYSSIAEHLENSSTRILGMTATLPSEQEKATEILKRLQISVVAERNETSPDVKPYIQETNTQWVNVELPSELKTIQKLLKSALDERYDLLKKNGLPLNDQQSLSSLLRLRPFVLSKSRKSAKPLFTGIRIHYALNILEAHGVSPFLQFCKRAQAKKGVGVRDLFELDPNFTKALSLAKEAKSKGIEHSKIPKLKEILNSIPGKALIFTSYRDSVDMIHAELLKMNIPAGILIGKAGDTGLKQKKQIEVVQKFRDGEFKVLVACLLYTSPSPRDKRQSRMPSSA